MAAVSSTFSTFSPFSSLPPELRHQIWCSALPEAIEPALFFYKKGCWGPRRLTESDEEYDPNNDELNLNFEFFYDLLDNGSFNMPLVFVNREARGIALAWIRDKGIQSHPTKHDHHHPILMVPFDPMRDALYIADGQWNDFICEPLDRLFEPDLINQNVSMCPHVTRIAVPEALVRSEPAAFPDLFMSFISVRVLFIVVDLPSTLPSTKNDKNIQHRWEMDNAQGGAFIWNHHRESFHFGGGMFLGDDALYKSIEEANKSLGESLVENHIRTFEVRPVFATRR